MRKISVVALTLALLLAAPAASASTLTNLLFKEKSYVFSGNSMMPALEDGDTIYGTKGPVRRGDIIVFKLKSRNGDKQVLAKRVIGLPGETVTLEGGEVYIAKKGAARKKLAEPYLDALSAGRTYRHPPAGEDPSAESFTVPGSGYFVLGDKREGSFDSRSYAVEDSYPSPFVPRSSVLVTVKRLVRDGKEMKVKGMTYR